MTRPPPLKKKVIYCIEDESSLLAVYAISFSTEQYHLALFSSGTVALECMKMVFPDLLFLDLSLPEIDGFAFLNLVNSCFPDATLPVVIVTGQSSALSVLKAKYFNVTAFFAKPLTPEKISTFTNNYFALKAEESTLVTKELVDCIKHEEEISILNFEKFLRLDYIDHKTNFFASLAKKGLVIDLGTLPKELVSNLKNFTVLRNIYKNKDLFNKVKISTTDELVLRFLSNLGKFSKGDLHIGRNAAVRNIRIDVEFNPEDER